MSFNDYPSSSHSSSSNAIIHEEVDSNLNNGDTTAVASPKNAIPIINSTIITVNASVTSTKSVLRNDIISDDPAKHSSVGHDVILIFLKIVDTKGYDNCMGHGKKGPFIKKINDQLHADDGPLARFKKTSDDTFLKKIIRALKVLDMHLNVSHSSGPGEDGEDYPPHLRQLIYLLSCGRCISLSHSCDELIELTKYRSASNVIKNIIFLNSSN